MTAACSSQSVNRLQFARDLVQKSQFEEEIDTSGLPIKVWSRLSDPRQPVHIYIEGDGHAWNQGGRPSLDPTPSNPVALKLAITDIHPNVIYLARPCQFVPLPDKSCHFSVWTEKRFSPDVVANLIDILSKKRFGGQPILLIGFSGGANIAIQLASQLNNVVGLITVAGNLDDQRFAEYHHSPKPFYGVNEDLLLRLESLPQLHIAGRLDPIVPPQLTQNMLKNVRQSKCVSTSVQQGARHQGPWYIPWNKLKQLRSQCMQ